MYLFRLQAALLHDTIEDTDTTLEEIKQVFGDNVASTFTSIICSSVEH